MTTGNNRSSQDRERSIDDARAENSEVIRKRLAERKVPNPFGSSNPATTPLPRQV